MTGVIERRMADLGVVLPRRPVPIASFLPFRVSQGLVYLAGQTCEQDGRVMWSGRVGEDLDLESGRQAARAVRAQPAGVVARGL